MSPKISKTISLKVEYVPQVLTKIFLDAMKDINPEDIPRNIVIIDKNKTRIRKEKL